MPQHAWTTKTFCGRPKLTDLRCKWSIDWSAWECWIENFNCGTLQHCKMSFTSLINFESLYSFWRAKSLQKGFCKVSKTGSTSCDSRLLELEGPVCWWKKELQRRLRSKYVWSALPQCHLWSYLKALTDLASRQRPRKTRICCRRRLEGNGNNETAGQVSWESTEYVQTMQMTEMNPQLSCAASTLFCHSGQNSAQHERQAPRMSLSRWGNRAKVNCKPIFSCSTKTQSSVTAILEAAWGEASWGFRLSSLWLEVTQSIDCNCEFRQHGKDFPWQSGLRFRDWHLSCFGHCYFISFCWKTAPVSRWTSLQSFLVTASWHLRLGTHQVGRVGLDGAAAGGKAWNWQQTHWTCAARPLWRYVFFLDVTGACSLFIVFKMPKANKKTDKKVCGGVASTSSSEISVRKFYSDSQAAEAILTSQPLTKNAKIIEERKLKKKTNKNSAKVDHIVQPGSTLHVSVRHGVFGVSAA